MQSIGEKRSAVGKGRRQGGAVPRCGRDRSGGARGDAPPGQDGNFLAAAVQNAVVPPYRGRDILKQIHFIGVKSLFVIVLTAAFTGMVLSLQGYFTLRKFGSEGLLGPRWPCH